ncbi:MAG: glycosyltransferase [Deltaproteobacteria bacterium]|nr:glycosyltransferase [Deltaproteobacteria bacterium]
MSTSLNGSVDVIMPFRDAAATIEEALDSVLSQRGVQTRVIAIDDGSRDAGPSIVLRMASRHSGVTSIKTPGFGVARAIALGFAQSRTALVARMDADDVSLPDRFSQQLDLLARDPRVAVAATQVEIFPSGLGAGLERYVAWQNSLLSPADHAREIFIESPLCHPTVLMRRTAICAVGGYRETAGPEDYDLWLRIDAAGGAIAKVGAPLFKWRRHLGQATFSAPHYVAARFTETKAPSLAARVSAAARGRRVVVWGAGPTGRRLARALTPHRICIALFVDIDPRKIGRVARGVPIVSRDRLDRMRDFVVVAVGSLGARALIRSDLGARQFVETIDFLCAA